MNNIYIKTKINFGENSLERLKEIKNKKIWIICDNFLVKNGNVKIILKTIDASNDILIFDEVIPDPPVSIISKGVALIKKINPDILIAYGGGSAIDTAKGIIYFAKMQKFVDKINFIAIPTTSGTGSEVTSATVITDSEENRKHIIFHESLVPDEAILDPSLTVSMPKNVTANTGIDVLTHAIEAYVAKNSNVYSDALAEKAVELVIESLLNCYNKGEDIKWRAKMHEASNLAGIAFNIAGLGINHSLAHQIGGKFHIPHGLANGILLTSVIDYNSKDENILKKYTKLAYKSGLIENKENNKLAIKILKGYINSLMELMNMPTSLRECNVKENEFNKIKVAMAENALEDNCTDTNPLEVNLDVLIRLFESIY